MTNIVNLLDTSADATLGSVRSSASTYLMGVDCYIDGSTTGYIQLFDAALSTDVTLGTTVPTQVIPIIGAGFKMFDGGVLFKLGCHYAVTTTATGNTAISPVALLNVLYQ